MAGPGDRPRPGAGHPVPRGRGQDPGRRPARPALGGYAIADAIQPRYRALVLAMFGSLRRGELMALRQIHVDVENRTVRIEASVVESKGGTSLGPTKTAAGRRTVAISEVIVPDLRWHLQRFAEPGVDGRVFIGPKAAFPRSAALGEHPRRRDGGEPEGADEPHGSRQLGRR